MDPIMNAVNDLSNSFESFQQRQHHRLQQLETKAFSYNRWEHPDLSHKKNDDPMLQAFRTYLRKGDERPLQDITQKALSTDPGEEGGYFIPQILELRLNQQVGEISPLRRLSNVMSISSSALELLLDRNGPNAGWAQESAARNETDSPTLQKVRIPVHELYAKPRVTERLLSDSVTSVENWLAECVARKMAQMENQAFINGDGQHKPKGFLNYETVLAADWEWGKFEHIKTGVDGAFAADGVGLDNLLELMGTLRPVYLKDAVWAMSRSAYVAIKKLKDQQGHYIALPGSQQDQRPMMFGHPIEIIEDMPGLVAGTASTSIVFGNFKESYQIVDHQGTQMLRDPYSAKPFVEFYTVKRVGGDVINFEALKMLRFAA